MDQLLLTTHHLMQQLAQQYALSPTREALLQVLQQRGPSLISDLARERQVALPTISKLVDELQQLGLVFRAHAKGDARKRLVIITQKGQQILLQVQQQRTNLWSQICADLGESERLQLEQGLLKLNRILQSEINNS